MSNDPLDGGLEAPVPPIAEAASSSAASDPSPAFTTHEASLSEATSGSKWNKNGYGERVVRHAGKFSKEESAIVKKAVEDYCAMKQINPARFCSECDHKTELKGAWMEIAKCLPNRSVQSIYRHGLRQLHPFKRGAWSDNEVHILLELVHRLGKKWSAIQSKLNRSADSCRDKYREMSDDYIKGRWKEDDVELLKKLIREFLRADPSTDLKELGKMVAQEGISIPWSTISKRMGNRSRLSCFKKWQKLTGLFSPSESNRVSKRSRNQGDVDDEDDEDEEEEIKILEESEEGRHIEETLTPHVSRPTAGEAVPITVTSVASATISASVSSMPDDDIYLLSELASSGASRETEIDWGSLRLENPMTRWNEILQEWQSTSNGANVLGLPLYEIAQLLLEQKTSAKMAAETVEAVDLPNPESLNPPDSLCQSV